MRITIPSIPFLIVTTGLLVALAAAQPTTSESGDGGPAVDASVNGPTDISLDHDGDIYFIEMITSRIRMIDAKTGVIHTIATGRQCCMDDQIKSPDPIFFAPSSINVDGSGNLYADDIGGQIWRFTSPNGLGDMPLKKPIAVTASKPEGGSATDQFEQLRGMTTDPQGSLFVVGSTSGKTFKISQGIATVVAGTGSRGFNGDGKSATEASFNWPMGLAMDATGNLFLADYENCRIRRIDKATAIVSTVAGTGKCSSTGDGGKATDATIDHPSAIAIDPYGNIYFNDVAPACVRRVDSKSGTIRSVANSCESKPGRNGGPSGLATDSAGNLYIALFRSNIIRRIDAKTGAVKTVAGNGRPDRIDIQL
jgi:sugar lactone lactonase YvrE